MKITIIECNKLLLDSFGLVVDDMIRIIDEDSTDTAYKVILNSSGKVRLQSQLTFNEYPLSELAGKEYEKVSYPKKPQKVGESLCGSYKSCSDCPLRWLSCNGIADSTLQEIFDNFKTNIGVKDEELEKIIQARLDEVEE